MNNTEIADVVEKVIGEKFGARLDQLEEALNKFTEVLLRKELEGTDQKAVDIGGAAKLLNVSKRTIQYYLQTKALVRRKIGRRTVIPVRSLESFLRVDHKSPARLAGAESGRAS